MKKIVYVIFSLIVLFVFTGTKPVEKKKAGSDLPAKQQTSYNGVQFNSDSNQKGNYKMYFAHSEIANLKNQHWTNTSSGNLNDKISSLYVGRDVILRIWKDSNYSGDKKTYTGPRRLDHMPGGWNDKASSFVLVKKAVTDNNAANNVVFHADSNFGGNQITFSGTDVDIPCVSMYGNWNDKISSIFIGKNKCLTVWKDEHYRGAKFTFKPNPGSNKSVYKMPSGWNDKISSAKIRPLNNCAQ